MPKLDPNKIIEPGSIDLPGVKIQRQGQAVTITGEPEVLRQIVFGIGDVVWPGWFENVKGRKIYLEYAEGCSDGRIDVVAKGFFNKAWPRVKKHLQVDGIPIHESP